MPAIVAATGKCLCGAVRFHVDGEARDVVVCHCGECRRWAGHVWAASAAPRDRVRIEGPVRWIDSPESTTHARRGFCRECGSSLFWDAPGRDTISFSAGALDAPTGLRTVREIYTEFAGDYYPVEGRPTAG